MCQVALEPGFPLVHRAKLPLQALPLCPPLKLRMLLLICMMLPRRERLVQEGLTLSVRFFNSF